MALFSNMALKTTQGEKPYKYLGVVDSSDHQGYLAYIIDQVISPSAKFAVENAHDGLVHMRSCVNNKYWVRSSTEGNWIVAAASEPKADDKSWDCTLFRMDLSDDGNKATFVHVQSGITLRLQYDGSDSTTMFMSIDPAAATTAVSVAFDYDTLVVLPQLVAFKADNGLFFDNDVDFPSCKCDDVGNDLIACEILPDGDGNILIIRKRLAEASYGRTAQLNWTRSGAIKDWVYMFPNIDDELPLDFLMRQPQNMFSVVKVADNVVALRNLESGKFCQRCDVTTDVGSVTDAISASAESIVKEAMFQVIEPVISRQVNVYEFDTDNARIYGLTPLSSNQGVFDNATDWEQQATLDLSITTTRSTTWSNSIGVTLGVTTKFKTGVPFIAEGSIEVSAEGSYEHQWEDTIEDSQTVGGEYVLAVPPKKRLVATGIATQGTCDVPFRYVQMDKLTTGETSKRVLADGVFTGVNAYSFYYNVEYIPIQDDGGVATSSLVRVTDHRKTKG